jgi:hypothetical protein
MDIGDPIREPFFNFDVFLVDNGGFFHAREQPAVSFSGRFIHACRHFDPLHVEGPPV